MKHQYTRLRGAVIGAIFFLLSASYASAAIPEDKSAAVVFVYQRIGEDALPQSNISIDQLKEHILELQKGGYAVLPLTKIVDAVRNGDPLPPRTVAITFEGAYQATLANAVPLLEDARMPFTIFFEADVLDSGNPNRMTWQQIKKLKKNKLVSFGILPAAYEHMANNAPEQNAALINRAVARYREILGEDPLFFSYPYGEFSAALKKYLSTYKFKAVFGQHSGVVHAGSDFMALPRFTMTSEYGDLDRFMLTANALPLPVTDVVPEDPVLGQNPPIIGFTVAPGLGNLSRLSCFASSLGKLPVTRIGDNRIEIRPAQPFADRRTRINCTLPEATVVPGEAQVWRWFGMQLISPALGEDDSEGSPQGSDAQPEDHAEIQPENQ